MDGRPDTYVVERDGRDVARLTRPRVVDMLWTRWEVELLEPVDSWHGAWQVRHERTGAIEVGVRIQPVDDGHVNVRTSAAEGPTGRERRGTARSGLRRRVRRTVGRLADRLEQALFGR